MTVRDWAILTIKATTVESKALVSSPSQLEPSRFPLLPDITDPEIQKHVMTHASSQNGIITGNEDLCLWYWAERQETRTYR